MCITLLLDATLWWMCVRACMCVYVLLFVLARCDQIHFCLPPSPLSLSIVAKNTFIPAPSPTPHFFVFFFTEVQLDEIVVERIASFTALLIEAGHNRKKKKKNSDTKISWWNWAGRRVMGQYTHTPDKNLWERRFRRERRERDLQDESLEVCHARRFIRYLAQMLDDGSRRKRCLGWCSWGVFLIKIWKEWAIATSTASHFVFFAHIFTFYNYLKEFKCYCSLLLVSFFFCMKYGRRNERHNITHTHTQRVTKP